MEPSKEQDPAGLDRLMEEVRRLSPLPDTEERSRAAAGRILKRAREKAGLKPEHVGPLYAAAYRRLYPHRKDRRHCSASTLGTWEDGVVVAPHDGRGSFLALFAVYILASPDDPAVSPEAVENTLFLYGYRRLQVEEIKALFPRGARSRGAAGDPSDVRSMRRLLDAERADQYYDNMLEAAPILRSTARVLADAEGTGVRDETVDKIESEARKVAASGADPNEFIQYLQELVRVSREPNSEGVMALLRMYTDRLSGDREELGGSERPPARGDRTLGL